ncbi:hypothetical protein Tsubulata_024157 [Turnera subulata]|uniref:F-box domain-containing protein n=1 Tax=Turnera subulata TaxID=218843 RepID=A0A9Q0GL71_9ROSI|nr:hypothetical protein Tsubulata_024157 [Turnera subulata]
MHRLPDDIVLHILSFLDDAKSLVRTSAISSQWKTRWSSHSRDLFFDESFSASAMLEILSALESQYVPKIGTFHFSHIPQYNRSISLLYDKVIKFAASRFVNNLTFNINHDVGSKHYPYAKACSYIFSAGVVRACPSLKTLRLNGCSLGYISLFPAVTSMHLESCYLFDLDLSRACPNLKELCLVDPKVWGPDGRGIKAGQNLVRLSLEYKSPSIRWKRRSFKISAPGLEYFRLEVDHRDDMEYIPLVDFPSLQCAVIDAAHPTERIDLIENNQNLSNRKLRRERRKQNSLFRLLQGLRKVKYLSLSPTSIQGLSMLPDRLERQPSPLARLKTLTLLENPVEVDFLHIPANVLIYLLGGSTSATLQLPCKREG